MIAFVQGKIILVVDDNMFIFTQIIEQKGAWSLQK